jgi:hypothetical protein
MIIHVLPGDAYADTFRETGIEGEVAVFRECLVEGDVTGDGTDELWRSREQFLSGAYPDPDKNYHDHVISEIEKFAHAKAGDQVDLWFEYELFCSVNYWFCLSLLADSTADVYRVAPSVRDDSTKWRGFGTLDAQELIECWNHRVRLTQADLKLGRDLWDVYRHKNIEQLLRLGTAASPAFPYLIDVTEAAEVIETRPKQIVEEIVAEGAKDFSEVFSQFARRAGVYGFGDVQVKRIFDSL